RQGPVYLSGNEPPDESRSGFAELWDVQSREEVAVFRQNEQVNCLAYASVRLGNEIRSDKSRVGRQLRSPREDRPGRSHDRWVGSRQRRTSALSGIRRRGDRSNPEGYFVRRLNVQGIRLVRRAARELRS